MTKRTRPSGTQYAFMKASNAAARNKEFTALLKRWRVVDNLCITTDYASRPKNLD